jgi:hypothetical protein
MVPPLEDPVLPPITTPLLGMVKVAAPHVPVWLDTADGTQLLSTL